MGGGGRGSDTLLVRGGMGPKKLWLHLLEVEEAVTSGIT